MKIKTLMLVFLVSFAFFATTWAKSDVTLEDIRTAIKEKGAKWEAGETWISRLSPDERKKFLGLLSEEHLGIGTANPLSGAQLPDSFDWRDQNGYDWTTSIKGPQECGNCWAYAICGALEAVVKIALNEPELPSWSIDLSELYLCACARRACEGWIYPPALDYVKSRGIPDQGCFPASYPPLAPCSDTCANRHSRSIFIENWYYEDLPDPDVIKDRLMTYGPLLVGMRVYGDFYSYRGGIYEHVSGDYEGGHAIVMVGWGKAGVDSFWICKNSWATSWGEDGWFRIKMITAGVGIEDEISYLTVDPASIPRITVTVPNKDNRWLVGTSEKIRWLSPYFIGYVKIEYSTNNGSTWALVEDSTFDDGSYTWLVIPDTPSKNCKIKVSDVVDGDPYDITDSTFYIIPLGDVDCNANVDVVDVVYLINYVFRSGPEPCILNGGNVNCDLMGITIQDIVFLVNYVFKGGPRPEC